MNSNECPGANSVLRNAAGAVDVFTSTAAWAKNETLKIWAERETSSTNTIAKEDSNELFTPTLVAGGKVSAPSLYLAERQTHGRGRGTNRWETPPAAALLSSWSFALASAPQPVLSPQVGLALFDAARTTWPEIQFNLKAPNDLYIGKHKVGGLLIETVDWGHARRCVIGLGLNVASHPEQVATATSLLEALKEKSMPEAQWQKFLSSLRLNLQTALLDGQSAQISSAVRERLKIALNLHPFLSEPILEVDERGQLRSASRTIFWHEL